MARYAELYYEDIDAFNTDFEGVLEMEARQLGSGCVGGRQSVELPGVTAHLFYHDADIHIQEVATSEALLLGSLTSASKGARWFGRELSDNEIVTQRFGGHYDYIIAAGSVGYLIEIAPEIAACLGFDCSQSPSFLVSREDMRDYHSAAGLVVDLGRSWNVGAMDPRGVMTLRDVLLKKVGALYGRSMARCSFGGRSYELVKAAELRVAQSMSEAPVVIPRLAASLGVAERTLRHGFETWAGMGPLKYFAIRRLHEFRKTMLAGNRGRGLIKESAAKHGFSHLGQLSSDYRKLFGETPSETLRRREVSRSDDQRSRASSPRFKSETCRRR